MKDKLFRRIAVSGPKKFLDFPETAPLIVPWVPEVFLARFPVSVMSLLCSASGRRPPFREKNLWYPGYSDRRSVITHFGCLVCFDSV